MCARVGIDIHVGSMYVSMCVGGVGVCRGVCMVGGGVYVYVGVCTCRCVGVYVCMYVVLCTAMRFVML